MNTKALSNRLERLRQEKRELSVKFGVMATTPKSSPDFSYAKFDDWQKKLDRMTEEEEELEAQLHEAQLNDLLAAIKK